MQRFTRVNSALHVHIRLCSIVETVPQPLLSETNLLLLQELKKVSAEKRLVLDTVNEVGSALLDLVPWRAREGLDRLVADANQRYRQADETITQRVQLVQAAIQRSQQVLQGV